MTNPISRTSAGSNITTPKGDYTIRPGDTLSKLAERFKVTVQDLLDANPQITNKDLIRAGAQLNIPRGEQPAPVETPPAPVETPKNDKFQKPVERDRNTGPLKTPEKVVAPGLDGVRSGEVVLSNGAKGPAVKEAQELLQKNGFPLKKFGADSDFGKETETAVKSFQKQNSLEPTGKIDKDTLVKLEAGAKQNAKYPEYDKLFADGVLRQTLAVGYDEGGADKGQTQKLVDGLVKQGYDPIDVSKLSDAEIKSKLGVDPATIDKDGTYFVKKFQHHGKDVTAVTRLITASTPNAKEKFAQAMNTDEVVMYTGHGRYGSGPDFDDIKSTKGNYVIGQPFEAGHVKIGENDLKKANMTKDYQLVFFDGCNTKYYLDDIRTKAKGKDSSNLDVIGANTELSWGTSADDVLAVTGGLTSGQSIDDIKSELNRINTEGPNDKVKDKFLFDGFKDNAVQSHVR